MTANLQDLIAEYEEYFLLGGIQQSFSELEQLVKEIGDRKFDSLCEIGIADGGTLWLFSHLFANRGATFTCIDNDIRPLTLKVIEAIEESMQIKFIILHGDNMLMKPCAYNIDFLYIDGNHSFEGVMHDYKTHFPSVLPGGFVAIHDTLLMEGPSKLRNLIEISGPPSKTFKGTDTLCNCFGPNRINPSNLSFGTTVIWK